MASVNKVARLIHDTIEYAKTSTIQAIVLAVNDGKIKGINKDADLSTLDKVIKSAIDQAYSKTGPSIDRAIAELSQQPAKKNV